VSELVANILIVDDRPENLLAVESILQPLGQRLVRAHSGQEALREVLRTDFAVILMDVQMPVLNGFETVEMIKSRERSRYTPIIFLTAISKDEEYVFTGYSAGAVDYMFKPLQPDILRSKVAVFVDLFLKTEELKQKQEELRASERREGQLRHEAALREHEKKAAAELRALNQKLSERQRELERAISARSRFYANMSHELRTPINAILGYSSLMLDEIYGPMPPQQREGVERTLRAARHLLELVNDVLDLSKIEAGKIELQIDQLHVPAVIEDLFATVKPLTAEYGSTLTLECQAPPTTITTDPRRVRQILLNLLSNAVKFGDGKPIRVVYRRTDDGGVAVDVIDHGRGIAAPDQIKIFDEFVQLEQEKRTDGTGLGLPISLRLAELLEGELTVESSPDAGSTFTLRLPAELTADVLEDSDRSPEHAA